MKYFDTHTHLHSDAYDEDRYDVLVRAYEQGVDRMLLPSEDFADSKRAYECAKSLRRVKKFGKAIPTLYFAIGVHPQEADKWNEDSYQNFKALAEEAMAEEGFEEPLLLAIGEIGLDYYYENAPRETQKRVYRQQLELAHELHLPVIIHERDAAADNLEILKKAKADGLLEDNFVAHCYSGSAETARELKKLGARFGFDGPVTFKNAKKAPQVLQSLELGDVVAETDCPYLTPEPYRGRRNEPAYLKYIVLYMAMHMGIIELKSELRHKKSEKAQALHDEHIKELETNEKYIKFVKDIYDNSLELYKLNA